MCASGYRLGRRSNTKTPVPLGAPPQSCWSYKNHDSICPILISRVHSLQKQLRKQPRASSTRPAQRQLRQVCTPLIRSPPARNDHHASPLLSEVLCSPSYPIHTLDRTFACTSRRKNHGPRRGYTRHSAHGRLSQPRVARSTCVQDGPRMMRMAASRRILGLHTSESLRSGRLKRPVAVLA